MMSTLHFIYMNINVSCSVLQCQTGRFPNVLLSCLVTLILSLSLDCHCTITILLLSRPVILILSLSLHNNYNHTLPVTTSLLLYCLCHWCPLPLNSRLSLPCFVLHFHCTVNQITPSCLSHSYCPDVIALDQTAPCTTVLSPVMHSEYSGAVW